MSEGQPGESWASVAGYEGVYEVSTEGRVRRLTNWKGGPLAVPHILRHSLPDKGYAQVNLSLDGRAQTKKVHLLVAAAFLGPCPDGMEVHHRNDTPSDPRLGNLVYVTPLQNQQYRLAAGRGVGERSGSAKLTAATVREILASDESGPVLAQRYGVSRTTINDIRRRERWRSVDCADPRPRVATSRGVGVANGKAKLSAGAVLAIRASGEASSVLAQRYGVSRGAINRVRCGQSWAHVPALAVATDWRERLAPECYADPAEEWRLLPGNDKYAVSSRGRVCVLGDPRRPHGGKLLAVHQRAGSRYVVLNEDGTQRQRAVSTVFMRAFLDR